MIVDKLKEICEVNAWFFNYGKEHWQNLNDFKDDSENTGQCQQKYFLLIWKDRTFKLNDYSEIEGYSWEGEFVFCVRSKLSDKDQNQKYEQRVKYLESEIEKVFEHFGICDEWEVKSWKELEVYDSYDTNVDGLKVRFKIEINEA